MGPYRSKKSQCARYGLCVCDRKGKLAVLMANNLAKQFKQYFGTKKAKSQENIALQECSYVVGLQGTNVDGDNNEIFLHIGYTHFGTFQMACLRRMRISDDLLELANDTLDTRMLTEFLKDLVDAQFSCKAQLYRILSDGSTVDEAVMYPKFVQIEKESEIFDFWDGEENEKKRKGRRKRPLSGPKPGQQRRSTKPRGQGQQGQGPSCHDDDDAAAANDDDNGDDAVEDSVESILEAMFMAEQDDIEIDDDEESESEHKNTNGEAAVDIDSVLKEWAEQNVELESELELEEVVQSKEDDIPEVPETHPQPEPECEAAQILIDDDADQQDPSPPEGAAASASSAPAPAAPAGGDPIGNDNGEDGFRFLVQLNKNQE